MRNALRVCGLSLIVWWGATGAFAQATAELSRADKWREDLKTLATELPQRHKNLFFHLPRPQFEREISQLSAAVPKLTDAEIKLGLWRLAAKIGDAHTRIDYNSEKTFPLALYQFSDGVFVAAATAEQRALLGAQLLKLGDTGIEQAKALVRQVIPVENESWFKAQFPGYLTDPDLLVLLKILPSAESGRFTFKGRDGQEFSVTLKPLAWQASPKFLRPFDGASDKLPLQYRNSQANYWYEYLPETKTLYLSYNRCQEMPNQPFKDFAAEVWKVVEEQGAERLVIDLRRNGGGNSIIFEPFTTALKQHPRLNQKGKAFVLIGRSTFSSAFLNALRLKRETKAILVGEPTGQKPNAYGEVRNFTLPHSKLVVRYSTKYFPMMEGDPPSLEPDQLIERSAQDFYTGRDPVLEWVLRYPR